MRGGTEVSEKDAASRQLELHYTFAGCNRVANALAWATSGLVAFASHNSIAVYDAEAARILMKLLGHTDRVNCVCWLPSAHDEAAQQLVSGAADNAVIVWRLEPDGKPLWTILARLEKHEGPVSALAACSLGPSRTLLASAAADGQVLLWRSEAPTPHGLVIWRVHQCIALPLRLQHTLALERLPGRGDGLLLAMGGVDHVIRLYQAPLDGSFEFACQLAGHADWIRSLAFQAVEGSRLLLASAAQDRNVRIWSIAEERTTAENGHAASSGEDGLTRFAPKTGFTAAGRRFRAAAEALLAGHEDWVHSVAWGPAGAAAGSRPCLLSASMDRTMAVWRADLQSGLWMSEESVGDAGPSNLGYFGGVWNPDGDAILAHGYTGALHLWRREGSRRGSWAPAPAAGGHVGPVHDLAWAAGGACLISASADQTARVVAAPPDGAWREIARPQVHGHDFSCLACIPGAGGRPSWYVSGSEEKVIRVLEAPRAFSDTLATVTGRADLAAAQLPANEEERALGASVPALGLSNRAVYASEEATQAEGPDVAPRASPGSVGARPLEEHLQQSTLWPEVYKAYGHGSEVHCLAADPLGDFLASACRAQAKQVAAIWIWRVGTWAPVQQLEAHTLTVTQLAFTSDGTHLASVSRDRSVAVWERTADSRAPYALQGRAVKAHARIIWAVDCEPGGLYFATGARDNLVKLWAFGIGGTGFNGRPFAVLPAFPSSVHALAFAGGCGPNERLLAVGLEDGRVRLHAVRVACRAGGETPSLEGERCEWESPPHASHAATVRRLRWRASAAGEINLLASASDDHAVHVYGLSGIQRAHAAYER